MYICFNSLIQRRRYNYLNQICLCLPCVNLYSSAFKRNLYSSDSEIRYCTYQYIVWISFTHYFVTVRLVCQRKIIINNSVGKLHAWLYRDSGGLGLNLVWSIFSFPYCYIWCYDHLWGNPRNVTGQTGLMASTRGMFNRPSAHKLALAKFPFTCKTNFSIHSDKHASDYSVST